MSEWISLPQAQSNDRNYLWGGHWAHLLFICFLAVFAWTLMITIKISGINQTLRELEKAAGIVSGYGGILKPAWKAIGIAALRLVSENFIGQGSTTGRWKSLSPVTVLLRRRGAGAKIADEADLAAKRSRIKILQDTGLLFQSLSLGAQGNILETGNMQVTVGTSDRKVQIHQKGGVSEPFSFGGENRKRFEANIVKRLPGAPQKRPGGKSTHSNPFYGKWFVILTGMQGKRFPIPRRQIFWEFRPQEVAQFTAILQKQIDKKLEGLKL